MSKLIRLHTDEHGRTVVRIVAIDGVAGRTVGTYTSSLEDVRAALRGLRLPVGVWNASALRVAAIRDRLGGCC